MRKKKKSANTGVLVALIGAIAVLLVFAVAVIAWSMRGSPPAAVATAEPISDSAETPVLIGSVAPRPATPLETAAPQPPPVATAVQATAVASSPAAPPAPIGPTLSALANAYDFALSSNAGWLIAFSRPNRRAPVGADEGAVVVCNLATGDEVVSSVAAALVNTLGVSNDGKLGFCHTDKPDQFILQDIPTRTEKMRCDGQGFKKAWLTRDSRRLVAWDLHTKIGIFDLTERKWEVRKVIVDGLFGVADYCAANDTFAGATLVRTTANGQTEAAALVQIYQPDSGGRPIQITMPETVCGLRFSADGGTLAAIDLNAQISVCDTKTWQFRALSPRPADFMQRCKPVVVADERQIFVAPDGSWMAAGIHYTNRSGGGHQLFPLAESWDLATGQRRFAVETGNPEPMVSALSNRRMMLVRPGKFEWLEAMSGKPLANPFQP